MENNAAQVPAQGGGQPPNMYANLLAGYQSALQGNYGQQISNANRDQQAYQSELFRQQEQLRKQNGFWNRLKNSFGNGLVNFAGQIPSMAMKAGMTALGGPVGGLMASGAMDGGGAGGGGNPYADSMAASMPMNPRQGPIGYGGGSDIMAGPMNPATRMGY